MKPAPKQQRKQDVQDAKVTSDNAGHQTPENLKSSGGLFALWIVVNALIWCQLFLPAESVGQGDLVLIHSCWFAVLAIAGWGIFKFSNQPLHFDGIDFFLGLICAGPVISFCAMWMTGGELRTGLFFVWGWLATAITVLLMRRLIPVFSIKRPVVIVLSSAVVMSFLGIYQHFYFYAATEAEVLPLIESYQSAVRNLETSQKSGLSPQRALEKKSALENQLSRLGIPREIHAQQMFVSRLRDSREPFGFFALANTFGGFLAFALVLGVGVVFQLTSNSSSRIQLVISIIVCLILAYSLLLTKSRTALVGGIFGLTVLMVSQLKLFKFTGIRSYKYVGVGLVLMVIITGIAIGTGSLDIQVISESSKSLSYRIDYWKSSWDMLQHHFVFGAGPGNFRQHYLEFKQPQSSEEILDPHNLWLDAWSNGGLITLIGLFGLLILSAFSLLQNRYPNEETPKSMSQTSAKGVLIVAGLSVAISGILAPPEIVRYFEMTGFWVLTMVLTAFVIDWLTKSWSVPDGVLLIAATALFIHLHGAGGFSMPIILQVILIFAFSTRPVLPSVRLNPQLSGLLMMGIGLMMLGLSIPGVIRPRLAESVAMSKLLEAKSTSNYKRTIREWIEADGWNPNPWFQLSSQMRQEAEQAENPEKIRDACQLLEQAIARDPVGYQYYAERATCLYEHWQMTGSEQSLNSAIESHIQAVERYPTKPQLQVQLTDYYYQADNLESAKSAARKALRLDQINHDFGHSDRYLDEEQLKTLNGIVELEEGNPTDRS